MKTVAYEQVSDSKAKEQFFRDSGNFEFVKNLSSYISLDSHTSVPTSSTLLVSDGQILGAAITSFDGYRAKLWSMRIRNEFIEHAAMLLDASISRLIQQGAQRCLSLGAKTHSPLEDLGFSRPNISQIYHADSAAIDESLGRIKTQLQAEIVKPESAAAAWAIVTQILHKGQAYSGTADDFEGFLTFLKTPGSACFLFQLKTKVVAVVYAAFDGLAATIWHLQVESEHQGQGYGKEIVTYLLNDYWRPNVRVSIIVLNNNIRAQKFWTRLGFTPEKGCSILARNL